MIAGVLSLLGLLLMYDNVYGELRGGPDAAAVIGYDGLLPIELAIPFFLAVTVPLLLDIVVGFGAPTTVVAVALTASLWGIGRIAHARGKMADELGKRSAELREARDERTRLEVSDDRARLSRELDVLLQRRLGELAHLADEGVRERDAAAAAAALVDIERTSRRTWSR